MLIYLVGILSFCLIINYYILGEDLIAPSFIVNAAFLFSSTLALFSQKTWGTSFHFNTLMLILSTLVVFWSGCWVSERVFAGEKTKSAVNQNINCDMVLYQTSSISFKLILGVTSFIILMDILAFYYMYKFSIDLGNNQGYLNIIATLRPLIESKKIELPQFFNMLSIVPMVVSYFFLALYWGVAIVKGKYFTRLYYLFPILFYIPFILLSTGRTEFLRVTTYSLLIIAVLIQKRFGYSSKVNFKILVYSFLLILIFSFCFFSAGHFTGKIITNDRTPFIIVAHYTGAQIPALDVFLNTYMIPDDGFIGKSTLLPEYRALRALGVNLPQTSMFLEFVKYNTVDTNIYTPIRRYIQDYGYSGMLMAYFLIGLIYTYAYNFIKYRSDNLIYLVLYAFCSIPLFMLAHDEILLTNLVSLGNIIRIIFFFLVYHIFLKILKGDAYVG